MKKYLLIAVFVTLACGIDARAQSKPTPTPAPPPARTPLPPAGFDLTQYGVRIQPDVRLIVMMAALEAAGFDPVPAGQEPSPFRAQVRKELADLDTDLRDRMRTSFERNNRKLAQATPAEQAARYVSLAYALGPAPDLNPPARSEDLPGGLLEVLDFAPLVREFYRKSGIEERMPQYLKAYQAEGDRLRQPTAEMVRNVLSYLHTQPLTIVTERVAVKSPGTSDNKKNVQQRYETREHERRFFVVPDLLAVPGAINLRVITDDYYVDVPPDTNPTSSELRRAYLQYVLDPLVLKNSRVISARRAEIRPLLDERISAGSRITPDVFLAIARSLVAAADARMSEVRQTEALTREARRKLESATTPAAREAITTALKTQREAAMDETIAELSDAYEDGAVLAFYFADQLKSLETSGFDIAKFLGDMITSFEPLKEKNRLAENAQARARAVAARNLRRAQRAANNADESATDSRRRELFKSLADVDELLRLRSYAEAETRLRELLQQYAGEPRIFFALGQAASLSAQDATDEEVQSERLNRALSHYRSAVLAASPDTDRALISRAHAAMGRILAFFDRPEEAVKEFDAAIALGKVEGGAYDQAVADKARLGQR